MVEKVEIVDNRVTMKVDLGDWDLRSITERRALSAMVKSSG